MNRNLLFVQVIQNLEEAEQDHNVRRQQFIRDRDPFHFMSDHLFLKHFRLTKALAFHLIEEIENFLTPPSRRSAITKEMKVLIALNFFATGSYQSAIGSNVYCGGVNQSSVSNCISEVVEALNQPLIFNRWVKFPTTLRELRENRTRFFEKYGIPGIVGVIDCTHVAIFPPSANDEVYPEHLYVNRKNYHSLNVQLSCDSNLKIINVNAKYPGSTHDSHIWNNSAVCPEMITLNRIHEGYYLIGDSGYALRPWLQIPVRDPEPDTPQFRYNISFKRARSIIERVNGVLKIRFRCLLKHRVLHYAPTKAAKIVNACTVLHNMCIENNLPVPEIEDVVEIDLGMYEDHNNDANGQGDVNLVAGRRLQNKIINNYFRHV